MIDWKRVGDLKREIGASEFDEVVELFLEEVESVMDRLRENPNPDLFEEDFHFLKGCSANLGFADLAGFCLAGETMAARGEAAKVNLSQIFNCYERSKIFFFEGMENGLAA
ncbi:Hpt domain-containing protein [Aliiruegeria lutimaris]|uniref:Hpt domain-containing protein n=1 Tax=Aliiruegeria lutimaris TaxID=571298 RepID=A0A1G8NGY6_9RHOB|nr:Hpt domain-containing protein [Aliiruegeria lutimaris]SDI79418.1 Hpt domain-containing protein [Aliiruegeria lutimaris]